MPNVIFVGTQGTGSVVFGDVLSDEMLQDDDAGRAACWEVCLSRVCIRVGLFLRSMTEPRFASGLGQLKPPQPVRAALTALTWLARPVMS